MSLEQQIRNRRIAQANQITDMCGGDNLVKGKEMPVGTVSNGRKKMPNGSWVPVSEEKSSSKTPHPKLKDSHRWQVESHMKQAIKGDKNITISMMGGDVTTHKKGEEFMYRATVQSKTRDKMRESLDSAGVDILSAKKFGELFN